MENKEILVKAYTKALLNGWKKFPLIQIDSIIFSHEFAKAFWGEREVIKSDKGPKGIGTIIGFNYGWKCHLQQMILEEEPLKYLEMFL